MKFQWLKYGFIIAIVLILILAGFSYTGFKKTTDGCIQGIVELGVPTHIEFAANTDIALLEQFSEILKENIPELKNVTVKGTGILKDEFVQRHKDDTLTLSSLEQYGQDDLRDIFRPEIVFELRDIEQVDISKLELNIMNEAKESGLIIEKFSTYGISYQRSVIKNLSNSSYLKYIYINIFQKDVNYPC